MGEVHGKRDVREPSRKRNAWYTLATLAATVFNAVGAYLYYVLWSEGTASRDLYTQLVEYAGAVAAAVLTLCVGTTALAYALGLDTKRSQRPVLRTWILAFSFFVFVTSYFVGRAQVAPENFLVWGIVLALDVLLASGWIWAERALGKTAIALARKAADNAPASIVYLWALLGLLLCPSNREAENLLGLALARLGRCEGAEHLLRQAYEDGERDPDLCKTLSQIAQCEGKLAEAAHYLEEAYHLAPSTGLFKRLIELWEKTGQHRKALDALHKLSPQEQHHWADHIERLTFAVGSVEEMRALCKQFEHDGAPYTRAHEGYHRILEKHPRDVTTLEALVTLAARNNDREEEKQLLMRLVSLCPQEPRYRRQLIEVLRWQGRNDEVLAQLDTLIDLGQATLREALDAAHEHFQQAAYDRVKQIISSVPELRASKQAAWLLAASYFENEKIDEAERELERAKTLSEDDDSDVRARLASLRHRIDEYKLERELSELAQRVEAAPDDLDLRFAYYDRLAAVGATDKVVVGLEELLEKRPELYETVLKQINYYLQRHGRNFRLQSYLSDLYLRERKWDEVLALHRAMAKEAPQGVKVLIEGAQKILRENPQHQPSLRVMAKFERDEGRDQSALEYLERYLAAGGEKDAEVLALEFALALKLGFEQRALDTGKELLQHTPKDVELLVHLAALEAKRGHYGEAYALAERASALQPENVELRELAKGYDRLNREARIETLRRQLNNDLEADAPLRLELGDLLYDFGRLNDALVEYQKASHSKTVGNEALAKLGYVLALKGLMAEAEEALAKVELRVDQPSEEAAKIKAFLYHAAELMEKDEEYNRALAIYRRIFHVDAGYRNVVSKIEKLQRLKLK